MALQTRLVLVFNPLSAYHDYNVFLIILFYTSRSGYRRCNNFFVISELQLQLQELQLQMSIITKLKSQTQTKLSIFIHLKL